MLQIKSKTKNSRLLLAAAALISVPASIDFLPQGTSGELKWIRVGSFQTYFSEQNSEVETGGLDDLNIRVCWPAQYGVRQSTMRGRTMWLGCKNFYDSQIDRTFSYKVIGVGRLISTTICATKYLFRRWNLNWWVNLTIRL